MPGLFDEHTLNPLAGNVRPFLLAEEGRFGGRKGLETLVAAEASGESARSLRFSRAGQPLGPDQITGLKTKYSTPITKHSMAKLIPRAHLFGNQPD